MRHGKYIGPHRELRGCGALIRPARGIGSRWVLAQFDTVKAPEALSMCSGWHCLPRRHFKPSPSYSQSHWRKIADSWHAGLRLRLKRAGEMQPPHKVGKTRELTADYDTPQMRALAYYAPNTYKETVARINRQKAEQMTFGPMSLEHRD